MHPSRLRRFIREMLRPWNALLFIFWSLFVYVWLRGWNNAAMFDRGWWFDAGGHALFGFLGALTFFYLFRRYAVRGIFNIAGDFFLALIIVSVVTSLGLLWEGIELGYDLAIQPSVADWLAKAQKNSVDTTIDMLENAGFAVLAMLAVAAYRALHRKRHSDESEREEIEELSARIEHLSRDLRRRRAEQLRVFNRRLLPSLRRLMQSIKRGDTEK